MARKVTGSHFNKMFCLVITKLIQMDLKNEYKVKNTETMTLTLPSNKNPTYSLCFAHIFKLLGHESGFHYLLATLNCFELDIHSMTAGIGSRNSGPIYPKILKL